jgi:hypothetical protein
MAFMTEPTAYHKTALSDLQGAWQVLREAVVEHPPLPNSRGFCFMSTRG